MNFESNTAVTDEDDEPNGDGNVDVQGSSNESEIFREPPKKLLPTLPSRLNGLVGITISIESENPRDVIELLGSILGVDDYKMNMISFWFLDALALQLLRNRENLDDHYASVLIGWLAGEMKLIQDKKPSREDFVGEMGEIFRAAADEVSRENRLPHWDQIVRGNTVEESLEESEKENHLLEKERHPIEISRNSKDQVSRRSSQKRRSKISVNGANTKMIISKNVEEEVPPIDGEPSRFSTIVDPLVVLDIIMESTYDMYVDELRYALIYAVFVEPIEAETHHLPFHFRIPRPMKPAEANPGSFDVRLQRKLDEQGLTEESGKRAEKGKAKAKTSKKKKGFSEVPPTPPPSMTDEDILANKRQFILPLIEANESLGVFETHEDNDHD